MGIKALDLTAQERFVSKYDDGWRASGNHTSAATVWLLGTLSGLQMSILKDDMAAFVEDGTMSLRSSENDVLAASMALRGWENFDTEYATELRAVRNVRMDVVAQDALATIPIEVLREIGQRVKAANSLTMSAEKNSGSGSSGSKSSKSASAPPAPPEAKNDGAAKQSKYKAKTETPLG